MTDGLHKGVKFRRQKLVFFHNERHLPDMIAKQTDILSLKKKKKPAKLSSCRDHIREPEKAEEEESSLGRTQKLSAVSEGEEHSVKGRK